MSDEKMYGSSLKGLRTTLKETLLEIGRINEKVVVIDCETGTATNILAFKKEFPDRFISLGVAEQNAISFAFGVARTGYIPVVPLFGAFLTRRACDQIFVQVGYARANIKMIGCYSGLTTPNTGATHQSINDLSIMRSIPNIIVLEACDEIEFKQMLMRCIDFDGPTYIRMIRGDVDGYTRALMPEGIQFEIGKSSILLEGNDITLAGNGMMLARCLEAAEELARRGISAEVINCSSIKPLDVQTLLNSVQKTKAVVTAENHSIIGGLGSAAAEFLGEQYPVPVKRVGIMDGFGESAPLEDLFPKYGLTSGAVVKAAEAALEMKRSKGKSKWSI